MQINSIPLVELLLKPIHIHW